eukprot:CAMPEP_0173187298 /NCGR_PEP_ID=MMETSP1141-20130122/10625_1 /TAXON_ID=483371 /ORGANISM="non described non described, Strain CCMP2298" /LENGTH=64 /DNA_ID=CAMNT_0014111107 /DNA_START=381 /DNA_END=572 /DNA_ORIENTATION=-
MHQGGAGDVGCSGRGQVGCVMCAPPAAAGQPVHSRLLGLCSPQRLAREFSSIPVPARRAAGTST